MRPLIVGGIFAIAACISVLGGYWVGRAGGLRALDQVHSNATMKLSELLDGNAELAVAIRQLDRRLAALEVGQLRAKQAETKPDDAPPSASAVPLGLAAIKEKELEKAAAIEASLRTEPRDSAWAPAAESQLQAAADAAVQQGAQYSVETLRCLTSICELVLSASSADKLGNTSLLLMQGMSGMSSIDIAPPESTADGTATSTYRLFRQGYPRSDEGT